MSRPPARDLEARVRATVASRQLFAGATQIVVGCSGGPDSQALLHVLQGLRAEFGCALHAISIDHGLRPEASGELALAAELARQLGIPHQVIAVQVPPGASLQAQAREVRYAALVGFARALGGARIAVGHTLDDQAETVLARLLRGSGLEGLGAATPRRADGVVRPLIDSPRALVHGYAAQQGLRWAEDPSNEDPRYLRVRIRQTLLPALCAENPQLAEQLAHLADDAREAAALLAERAESALARGGVGVLREEPPLVRRFALKRRIERETGIPLARAHLTALNGLLFTGEGRGQVRVPGDMIVSVRGGELSFEPVTKRGRGVTRPTHRAGKK